MMFGSTVQKKIFCKPGLVPQFCNLTYSWEAETRESQVQGLTGIQVRVCLKNKK